MQPKIRIIKRGAEVNSNDLVTKRFDKTDTERQREAVNTVKGWVAEWEARKRTLKTAALTLVRSLEDGDRNPAHV